MRMLLPLIGIWLCAGCARYDYFVEQPLGLAGQISQNHDTVLRLDPLAYHFREVSGRLVARIFNSSGAAVNLVGPASVVVDPSGQSRPVRSQLIAPDSFAKLIFPPMRPRIEPTGPTITFGVGVSSGGPGPYDSGGGVGVYDRYGGAYVVDDPAGYHWDWPGEGTIRVTLVYERGGESITHEFQIVKRKAG